VIAVTAVSSINGYEIVAYKGTAQGETFDELLRNAEALGANAILNTCFDDALDVDTLFHGAAVVIEPIATLPIPSRERGFLPATPPAPEIDQKAT
jgi:uncharacterized protein YbjQ (UPF0145 family)